MNYLLRAITEHQTSTDPNRDLIYLCQLYGLGCVDQSTFDRQYKALVDQIEQRQMAADKVAPR
jgi:hypothetical protein